VRHILTATSASIPAVQPRGCVASSAGSRAMSVMAAYDERCTIDAVIRACGGTGAQDITMVSVCRFPTKATPCGFPTLKFD
jgi:hypothetical protein